MQSMQKEGDQEPTLARTHKKKPVRACARFDLSTFQVPQPALNSPPFIFICLALAAPANSRINGSIVSKPSLS